MHALTNIESATSGAALWALVGIPGEGQPLRKVIIGGTQVLVGRLDETDLRLHFRGVSKRHAYLRLHNGKLLVRDLNSTNGTFVNGRRISQEVVLNTGDVVQFGNAPFQVTSDVGALPDQTQAEAIIDRATGLLQFDRLMAQRAVTPHFQPIINVRDERVVAFEVLARSSVVGLESAIEMFDVAAYVHQEAELSRMIREAGVRTGAALGRDSALFLNTHPTELGDEQLLPSLRDLRGAYPQLPMTLEIHESCVTNPLELSELYTELRAMDFKLAYDDFGAGQARIMELAEVPPDWLKFDRRLIKEVHTAPQQRQRMLASLIRMVGELGIVALAEGIESSEEAEVCRQLGFQLAQGYFYGRPRSARHWMSAV